MREPPAMNYRALVVSLAAIAVTSSIIWFACLCRGAAKWVIVGVGFGVALGGMIKHQLAYLDHLRRWRRWQAETIDLIAGRRSAGPM